MRRYSESEIADVADTIIHEHPGIRTSELIDRVREKMRPTGEDLEILDNRNDDKFSQKVRNLKSHRSLEGRARSTDERDCRWFPII